MITLDDLRTGAVARLKVSQLAKMADESSVTIGRAIKDGRLRAIVDPITRRLYVSSEEALRHLQGMEYKHDHLNQDAILRMEHARKHKAERCMKTNTSAPVGKAGAR